MIEMGVGLEMAGAGVAHTAGPHSAPYCPLVAGPHVPAGARCSAGLSGS
jgi:hypothetical protein